MVHIKMLFSSGFKENDVKDNIARVSWRGKHNFIFNRNLPLFEDSTLFHSAALQFSSLVQPGVNGKKKKKRIVAMWKGAAAHKV